MISQKEILIITQDKELAKQIEDLLEGVGLSCLAYSDRREISDLLAGGPPPIILVDADLGKDATMENCKDFRSKLGTDELAILVLVSNKDDETLSTLLAAGADDLINRTITPLSFRARIKAHLDRITTARKLAMRVHDSDVLIDVTSRMVGSADILDNLYEVASLISKELRVDRCSVVLVRPQRDFGLVVASSDNSDLRSLAINLNLYPEISHAVDSGAPLIIDDVSSSKLLERVLPSLKAVGLTSVALFPITRQKETVGVIFLRFLGRRLKFEERENIFCQTVANAASIALRNAEILELLKAKTREVEKVQNQARDELRTLKRYEELFIGALDGNVVIKQSGKIVFVNPRAETILNEKASVLEGRLFTDFLFSDERRGFNKLLDEFLHGKARRRADFHLESDPDRERVISISAGSLFGEEGSMLLTMRDVTEERLMERRLNETQEQLVDSEKRSAMAELAGAAAHELNQPLTSVMTSVALLNKIHSRDKTEQRILDTMVQETERMASLIRRMTKITSYATKNYVGKARIIDFDSACSDEPGKKEN